MSERNAVARRIILASMVGALLVAIGIALIPATSNAAVGCDLVATTTGSDGALGTEDAPLRSAQKLADTLSPGQTGCLAGGLFATDSTIKVTTPGITLTSYPGTRATLKGRLWIAADRVTVENLDLDGRNGEIGPRSPTITAADVTFRGNDVTNHHGATSCFGLGNSPYGRAVRTLIVDNRIHDCGRLPSQNYDHGIYVQEATDVVIRDNYIYDNVDRGIQLYPDAQGTRITGNVIDGNGEGIIFSGSGSRVSNNNVVTNNVIANSKIRYNAESGGDGAVGKGNVVRDNCVWASNPAKSGYYNRNGGIQSPSKNFTSTSNRIAKPVYVNRSAGNLSLASNSGCLGVLGTPTLARSSAPDVTALQHGKRVIVKLHAGARRVLATAAGSLTVKRRTYALAKVTRNVGDGNRAVLRLKPKRVRARRALRRALKHRRKVRAPISTTLVDDLGHRVVKRQTVRLR